MSSIVDGLYNADGTFSGSLAENLWLTDSHASRKKLENLVRLNIYAKSGAAVTQSENEAAIEQYLSDFWKLKPEARGEQIGALIEEAAHWKYTHDVEMTPEELMIYKFGFTPEIAAALHSGNNASVFQSDGQFWLPRVDANGNTIAYFNPETGETITP